MATAKAAKNAPNETPSAVNEKAVLATIAAAIARAADDSTFASILIAGAPAPVGPVEVVEALLAKAEKAAADAGREMKPNQRKEAKAILVLGGTRYADADKAAAALKKNNKMITSPQHTLRLGIAGLMMQGVNVEEAAKNVKRAIRTKLEAARAAMKRAAELIAEAKDNLGIADEKELAKLGKIHDTVAAYGVEPEKAAA